MSGAGTFDDAGEDATGAPAGNGRSAAGLCATAVRLLPVQGASIATLTSAGTYVLLAASNPVATRLAELHLDLGEGPALDAFRRGHPVLVPDLHRPAAARRWPVFADAALELGVASLAALPLRVGVIGLGAMLLHRDAPGELTTTELAQALRLADAAAFAVLDSTPVEEGGEAPGQPDGPAEQIGDGAPMMGAEVHQASGMIMVQLGIPIADALARLRARAFAEGRPVSAVARDVVARRLRFEK